MLGHETFWWLLALLAGAVVLFAVLMWLRLSRQAHEDKRVEELRKDVRDDAEP